MRLWSATERDLRRREDSGETLLSSGWQQRQHLFTRSRTLQLVAEQRRPLQNARDILDGTLIVSRKGWGGGSTLKVGAEAHLDVICTRRLRGIFANLFALFD